MIWISLLLASFTIILVLKEQWVLQNPWKITMLWRNLSKCSVCSLIDRIIFLNPAPISLSSDDIGDEGAVRLAEALKHNYTLTKLE
jgi:hypothetical protein